MAPYGNQLAFEMRDMLTGLLDISRIEAGGFTPKIQRIELSSLLNKIEVEFAPIAKSKEIRFRIRPSHTVILSDPILLGSILRNLIGNAVRYTLTGGVLVGCRHHQTPWGSALRIEVWDSGIGIPQDQVDNIFKEFHRLAHPPGEASRGLGLGLPIARRMADLLGHPLTVHSQHGQGSVFSLTVPLAQDGEMKRKKADSSSHDQLTNLSLAILGHNESMRIMLASWPCHLILANDIDDLLIKTLNTQHKPNILMIGSHQTDVYPRISWIRQRLGNIPVLCLSGSQDSARLENMHAGDQSWLSESATPTEIAARVYQLCHPEM